MEIPPWLMPSIALTSLLISGTSLWISNYTRKKTRIDIEDAEARIIEKSALHKLEFILETTEFNDEKIYTLKIVNPHSYTIKINTLSFEHDITLHEELFIGHIPENEMQKLIQQFNHPARLLRGHEIKKELSHSVSITAKSNRDIGLIEYPGYITISLNAQNNFLGDEWHYEFKIKIDERGNLFLEEINEKDPRKIDLDFTFIRGEHL